MTTSPVPVPAEDAEGTDSKTDYQAPCIETVLTQEELVREVLYAGSFISGDGA